MRTLDRQAGRRMTTKVGVMKHHRGLQVGDLVEVRSREEILATLDEDGRLDQLPFTPQMLELCGQRFRVFRSAHKTCDTIENTGIREMNDAVHLGDVRCDGRAYGGCQAACMLFWKEAWLRPVVSAATEVSVEGPSRSRPANSSGVQGVSDVQGILGGTRAPGSSEEDPTYVCQATQLFAATTPLAWWEPRQYWRDYLSGNVPLGGLARAAAYSAFSFAVRVSRKLRLPTTGALIKIYDAASTRLGDTPYPRRTGTIPEGIRTPELQRLDLAEGERVRVKSYDAILESLSVHNRNRGLYFDAEAVPYCGEEFTVRTVADKTMDEKTGKLVVMKTNSVILDGAYCKGLYSDRRMLCPRAVYPFWREGWLERVDGDSAAHGPPHDS